MKANDGFGLFGRTYNSGIFGTSSHFMYLRGGMLNSPHNDVRFVHGEPYHHGSYE